MQIAYYLYNYHLRQNNSLTHLLLPVIKISILSLFIYDLKLSSQMGKVNHLWFSELDPWGCCQPREIMFHVLKYEIQTAGYP